MHPEAILPRSLGGGLGLRDYPGVQVAFLCSRRESWDVCKFKVMPAAHQGRAWLFTLAYFTGSHLAQAPSSLCSHPGHPPLLSLCLSQK